MNYYEVAVYSGSKQLNVLTYCFDQDLNTGQHVLVKVRTKQQNGVVIRSVPKPKFKATKIDSVIDEPSVSPHLMKLASWLQEYYQSTASAVFRTILPKGIGKKRRDTKSYKIASEEQRSQLALTKNQSDAVKKINSTSKTSWLHGTTGSGKTRIYVELVEQVLRSGKDCIVLVPEISLTPQLVEQFKSLSNATNIIQIHSGVSEANKHILWRKLAESDQPTLVIGARSALFMPCKNLGLIIVDEAHETSYQQDQHPKYSSLRVASQICRLTDAKLVLGSATPPVAELYQAKELGVEIVELPEAVHKGARNIEIVDLKDKSLFTQHRWLSDRLLEAIQHSIDNDRQSLLLLNRRGTRQLASCQNCGWFAECPNCLIPLRYHHDTHLYYCHICGYYEKAKSTCPSCKQPEIKFTGVGTKQIEIDLKKHFSSANILRYDQDALSASNTHENLYSKLKGKNIDIVIGTQLVAKGFDLPRLDTIGIVNADTSLQLPDFSANERTFQMLYQVAGRGGRRGQDSQVFIQTFLPGNPTIIAAKDHDYDLFFDTEISDRKSAQLPPFVFMLRLECELKNPEKATEKAKLLADKIRQNHSGLHVFGPTPSFHEYSAGYYRRQLVIKAKNRRMFYPILQNLPSGWKFELDPIDLL